MSIINNYDNFVTESFKKEFKKLMHNITSYFGSEDDIEKLEADLLRLLNDYKIRILSGEIKRIDNQFIDSLKHEINKDVIEQLNLDTFFRGINNLTVKGKDRKIEKYFQDYMASIPSRLKTLYNVENADIGIKDDPNDIDTEGVYYDPYLDDNEFDEWRKVVSTAPRFRVKRRRFEIEKASLHIELLKMRDWLYKNNKKLIIVLEGRDAAGKGSFIRTATENLHPAYFRINTFGVPSEADKVNWFKRYKDVLPVNEQIAFYDRSWYNRAVVEPVMGYCTDAQYKKFMEEVLPFENSLIDNGYYLIKLWFSITDKTQELRFKLRKTSPIKYWKFSPNDARAMEKWDAFTAYKEEMFRKTSTEKSPWVVIDSNDKRVAKLNALRYILNQIPYDRKKEEILQVYPEIVYPII
jgi:polyphosphate kinase 2